MSEDKAQKIVNKLEAISTSLAALVAMGFFMLILLGLMLFAGRRDCPYINERGDRLMSYERKSDGAYDNCIYIAVGDDGL